MAKLTKTTRPLIFGASNWSCALPTNHFPHPPPRLVGGHLGWASGMAGGAAWMCGKPPPPMHHQLKLVSPCQPPLVGSHFGWANGMAGWAAWMSGSPSPRPPPQTPPAQAFWPHLFTHKQAQYEPTKASTSLSSSKNYYSIYLHI